MKCRLIAAGTRLPDWVNSGFQEYQKRLRVPLALELHEIPVATRRAGENPQRAIQREGADMLAALGKDDYVVALEIAAKTMNTEQLSAWLAERMRDGRSLALVDRMVLNSYSGIFRPALRDSKGAVGRAVVDDDDLLDA